MLRAVIDRPDPVAPYVTDDGVLVDELIEGDVGDLLLDAFMAARFIMQKRQRH